MIAIPKYFKGTKEELLSFYPRFYREIKEISAINEAMATEIDKIIDCGQKVLNDSNITTADESIIKFYEDIIGIGYSSLRTLEERRRLVLAYYNIFGKVSASKIKNAIMYYTGAEVEIRFTNKDKKGNYILEIECVRGTISSLFLDDIALLCKKILPAHLFLNFSITILPKGNVYVGSLPQIHNSITVYSKEV